MTETKIIVTMEDGSIFIMPHGAWVKAFRIKYGGMEKEAIQRFKKVVAKHWRERTIPTKFGFDDGWEEEYPDQASLGAEVMYQYIRAALLAVVMEEDALRHGEKTPPTVIGIDGDRVTEYTGHGKRKMSLEDLGGNSEHGRQGKKLAFKEGKRIKR